MWFEIVTVAKYQKIASVAQYIILVFPNEDEFVAMANALFPGNMFDTIMDPKGNKPSIQYWFELLRPVICVLLEKDIKIVPVTWDQMEFSNVQKKLQASRELIWREQNYMDLVDNFTKLWHQDVPQICTLLQEVLRKALIILLCISQCVLLQL